MFESKSSSLFEWLAQKQTLIGWVLVSLGLVSTLVGLAFLLRQQNLGLGGGTNEVMAVCPEVASQAAQLVANISGAVKKPGVYTLDAGARLSDLVAQAGGFVTSADALYVSKEINLAQVLSDGDKIYIPDEAEDLLGKTNENLAVEGATGGKTAGNTAGLISLNQASQEELESLSGIGEKRAEEIIANRPYQTIEELVEKEVVTENLWNEIKNSLCL